MTSGKLVMRLGGENNIDLGTLSVSLNAAVDILKSLSNNLMSENDFCKLKVLNMQKGSFVIDVEQIMEIAPTVMPMTLTVTKAFKEVLEIREFLKGSPPKEVVKSDDITKIENKYGDIYYANIMTVNIYNNDIKKGMTTTAKTVLNDNDRTGLSYEFADEGGRKDYLDLSRENLSYLSIPQDVDKLNKGTEENEVITWIKANKPDLNGRSQRGLTLNGKEVSCIISNQEFLDEVYDDKIPFLSNTKLYVRIVVKYKIRSFESGESSEIISRNIIEVLEIQNG